MTGAICVPYATRARLANPAPPGQRHTQIVEIAAALTANGLNAEATFCQLRPNYGPDVPDAEIWPIIRWAETRFGTANRSGVRDRSGAGLAATNGSGSRSNRAALVVPQRQRSALPVRSEAAVERFLGGFRCEEADLLERSPAQLPARTENDAAFLLERLFQPNELVNIVSAFGDSTGKPHPTGYGRTQTQTEWLANIARNGPPTSLAGTWIRLNPTDGRGVLDTNIVSFRFLLLESDALPLDLQISFFARLPLPISAIISSGGRSLHAWVKIDAETITDFRAISARIYAALIQFGIDRANKNPGRLSRLPGVPREIGGSGDKRQKLIYLNPEPIGQRIIE